MKRRVLGIASNDTHVTTYAALQPELEKRGAELTVLSLDEYYAQHAGRNPHALRFIELHRPNGLLSPGAFYRRPVPAVWRDVLRARAPIRRILRHESPHVVVLGNDRGLIEKAVIEQARAIGIRTVLVQDGRMAPSPRIIGHRAQLTQLGKRLLSPLLRGAGFGDLAATQYGSGGTDVICASGEASAEVLRRRARKRTAVTITGQPRYDAIPAVPADRHRRWDVVAFTTPFEHAGLGRRYQHRQMRLVIGLAAWADRHERQFRVKPHPRENSHEYRTAINSDVVLEGDPISALHDARIAVIGISTLLEEAAFMACPVVVPGATVHGSEFDDLLPPADTYPRGDSPDDLHSRIEELLEVSGRNSVLAAQRAYVSRQVQRDPDRPAARLVAEVILDQ